MSIRYKKNVISYCTFFFMDYNVGMKQGNNFNKEDAMLEIWAEIHRDKFARNEHRLHAVLLVIQGLSRRKVADLLGDSPVTVAYWARKFKTEGIDGLLEGERTGRPSRLNTEQMKVVAEALNQTPSHYNLDGDKWDGERLSLFAKNKFSVDLSIRQCQRLIRRLKSK